MANETVFRRDPKNPILTPESVGGDVNSIHNSAIIKFRDKYLGLFRIDDQGLREGLYKGTSDDGYRWSIDPHWIRVKPRYADVPDPGRLAFDPRITLIDGVYYVAYCYWYCDHKFSTASLIKTEDFETFEHLPFPLPPQNRNAVLFPGKIGGKFTLLHRPSGGGDGDIFVSQSPDMVYWGDHRPVMMRGGGFGWLKIGPGPAPIEIDEGWLMVFHAVRQTGTGVVYCVGGAILDRDDPSKVLHRGVRYLLAPTEDYERIGDVCNVTFPTSLLHDEKTGALDLYYGCADTRIGHATANVREVVKFIIDNRAKDASF